MDSNDAKKPTITALIDPPRPSQTKDIKRRYRRCKSAPTEFVFPGKDGGTDLPKSIFTKFHPSFWQVGLFLGVYLGVGTLCFYLFKSQIKGKKTNGALDAAYLCIVTMTTVGYGDLVPNSIATKLLACAFVFTGMALVGLVLSKAADYLVEKQEMLLVKALHFHQQVGRIDIMKEIKTNRVKYKLLMIVGLLLVLMIVGTIFLSRVEDLGLVDSFYCVCSTMTSLGYGDKSFSTFGGRIFAVFWILTSTICMAQFFLYLAELNTEHRQRLLVKWVLKRRMTRVDLEAADFDDDGVVSQEDIALIMEEFKDLDIDQTGTLSASDITLAQSSQA
ncbi:hypothetical protein IFM89_025419 [Coptis chinensis]|uniref:Potassium channel domain-containing protein n=1 Tax=Coptis chinensis TaxID=261450 RepID=A0A835LX78_9MAGN|nr:hypothetical protein IFM89_025419 [Coptis chinensis]